MIQGDIKMKRLITIVALIMTTSVFASPSRDNCYTRVIHRPSVHSVQKHVPHHVVRHHHVRCRFWVPPRSVWVLDVLRGRILITIPGYWEFR